ncbi:MAG: aminoglycoside phosphotransferase [Thiothrix sp.]|nr:MAG: aminoglycoside phosphotransferase [Thiothrix sp.]
MESETDVRLESLKQWIKHQPGLDKADIVPASADASFRRYFRITHAGGSLIAMDAPPEQENVSPFIDITHRLEKANLQVPHIHASDLQQGFLLLDDLGSQNFLRGLNSNSVDELYGDALSALVKIQSADTEDLPIYENKLLATELCLFQDWYLGIHLGIKLSQDQHEQLGKVFSALIDNALEQPQVFVHRDYHSRNLMITAENNPGIIDYQDAVLGPVTYDLVSLLRDCYISWPIEQVKVWALHYRDQAVANDLLAPIQDQQFLRWFDLMGIQRHLKAIGIFARLNHRDGKPGYLGDIPRTLNYVLQIASCYEETERLVGLLNDLGIK